MIKINILCLKWGTKYSAKYVNRLYNQCIDHIKIPFAFHCITDNIEGLKSDVITHDIAKYKIPNGEWGGYVWTSEKIKAVTDPIFEGKILLLDIDMLILKDWTEYLSEYNPSKLTVIKSPWVDRNHLHANFGSFGTGVNSSIIFTYAKNKHVHDTIFNNRYNYNYYSYCYKGLDKTLYNACSSLIDYLPHKTAYSYNKGHEPSREQVYLRLPDYNVCLFNNNEYNGIELHDATGWAKEYWESYD